MSVGQDPHRTHIGAAVIAIEIADLDPAVGGGVDEGPAAQINAHMGDVAAAIGEEHQVPGQRSAVDTRVKAYSWSLAPWDMR